MYSEGSVLYFIMKTNCGSMIQKRQCFKMALKFVQGEMRRLRMGVAIHCLRSK